MTATKNIIIKLTNQAVWFNDEVFLALKNTNLPAGEFEFTQGRDIFWESEMLAFDRDSGALTIRIVNFRPAMIDDFLNQKPKAEVKQLIFKDLYWPALNADLSVYKKSSFVHLLSDHMPSQIADGKDSVLHIRAEIPFSKLRFGAGFVSFDYKFLWKDEKETIKIQNNHILPEFEYIKSYFARHFNNRNLSVLMVVTKSGKTINHIKATSPQIERIKDVAIDTIKFVRLDALKKPPKFIKEIDKSLFTPEDIFDPFDRSLLGTNNLTQKEILDHIMSWEGIRNKKHLEYLAGNLHDSSEKIMFTLTPKFGFVFTALGDKMVHYIWEMLNTNATYIWSFDPILCKKKDQLEKIEVVISFIRNHGRDAYLRNHPAHEDVIFRRIMHQGAGSQLVDYFPRWRHSIMETIF
jgi:hypothetical protein